MNLAGLKACATDGGMDLAGLKACATDGAHGCQMVAPMYLSGDVASL